MIDSARTVATLFRDRRRPDSLDGDVDPQDIHRSLAEHAGQLRHAVARAITRKRVPQLTFLVQSDPV